MIVGTVKGDEKVIQRMNSIPPKLRARLRLEVKRLTIDLQSYVVANKLSGQVLKRRTGTLARSIQPTFVDTKDVMIGIVGSRSSEKAALKYARPHEYGFKGPVNIKEHLRKIKMAFGRPIAPMTITVSQHTMNMNMPERSFLRSSLKENKSNIQVKIKEAIKEGLKA